MGRDIQTTLYGLIQVFLVFSSGPEKLNEFMRRTTSKLIAMFQSGISVLSTSLHLGDLPSCGKIQLAQTLYIFHERPRKIVWYLNTAGKAMPPMR